jgi:flagellar FliJ protein
MAKPFSLQTVLDLMQIRTDEATRQLATLIANERDAKNKLEMLQKYRDEYATRLGEAARNGLNQREWRNFQDFLNRLDEAIDAQNKTLNAQIKRKEAGQELWQQQRKKLKAFDTLSERHANSEKSRESKREQKLQDEFAGRRNNDKG